MNDIERAIARVHIREPLLQEDGGIFSMTQKIVTEQVENIENVMVESIINCLPEDVTDVILVDKKKISEIFMKQIPKNPHDKYIVLGLQSGLCPVCRTQVLILDKFCSGCGQALDWKEG